jgi:hemoglobin-like flavoprotein
MGITRHPLFSDPEGHGDIPLDSRPITTLTESFALVSARSDEFTRTFYGILFERHPELRGLFPKSMDAQRRKLAETLGSVVMNLSRPALIRHDLLELGRGHVGYGAREEHYPLICDALVTAMGRVVGPTWTPELERDWRRALQLISVLMIEGARKQA